jgi:hypothetical protein
MFSERYETKFIQNLGEFRSQILISQESFFSLKECQKKIKSHAKSVQIIDPLTPIAP